jgi:hypothetical protein
MIDEIGDLVNQDAERPVVRAYGDRRHEDISMAQSVQYFEITPIYGIIFKLNFQGAKYDSLHH